MTSILKVDTIQNSTGTDALSIDTNGDVTASTTLKIANRPRCQARGITSSANFTTNRDYVTSWATTDFDPLSMFSSGRIIIPKQGLYSITLFSNGVTSTNYNTIGLVSEDAVTSTQTEYFLHYASNDYGNYTVGQTTLLELDVNDILYAVWDDRYGVPQPSSGYSVFSALFIE